VKVVGVPKQKAQGESNPEVVEFMKIENSDKCPQFGPKPAEKTGTGENRAQFAQILQQTVRTESSTSVTQPAISAPLCPVEFAVRPETSVLAAQQTGELLDTLETYRQLLAQPSVSLRKIQPVVEQLGHEADRLAASMHQLPQEHSLAQIMREALIQVNQEIERFNQGEYI
jgi:hypothetical protein